MLTVELIYDTDCPNVNEARAQLMRAFAEVGLSPRWREWDRGAPEGPAYVRDYGSPTILANGQDVADASPSAGDDCCRIYLKRSHNTSRTRKSYENAGLLPFMRLVLETSHTPILCSFLLPVFSLVYTFNISKGNKRNFDYKSSILTLL